MTEAFDKQLRVKISDNNFEWRFDDFLVIFKFVNRKDSYEFSVYQECVRKSPYMC